MNQAELHFDDFTGFTFKDTHSSNYNLYRVSNGSRYSENLLPTFSDVTTLVDGVEETYYWDSRFTQRQFQLQVAFDEISETQFRGLRKWLSEKDPCDLIFDERPYKTYTAKIQQAPQLTYICFEENGARVYKGEGTITFVCYYPFARSNIKFLSECYVSGIYGSGSLKDRYKNLSQWSVSSEIPQTNNNTIYNPGDISTPPKLFFNFQGDTLSIGAITLNKNGTLCGELTLSNSLSKKTNDTKICINMKTNLIEGYNGNNQTGNLYNEYIISGDFFKIPIGGPYTITTNNLSSVEYDYLYY